jgi:ATP-dependent protease ClpP protease subunit
MNSAATEPQDVGLVPMVIESTGRGERAYDIYSRMLKERVVFHQPWGGFQGQASDIDIHAQEILDLKKRLNKLLVLHTGQDDQTVARDTDRDYFMGGQQAVEYGLIDSVLDKRQ